MTTTTSGKLIRAIIATIIIEVMTTMAIILIAFPVLQQQ